MKKINLKIRVFRGDGLWIFAREGWLMPHRYDKEINIALVRQDWEVCNTNRWSIIDVSTGMQVADSFKTRNEAINWLENKYNEGLTLEKFKDLIKNSLSLIEKAITNIPLPE